MTRVYLDHNATTPMRPEVRAHFIEVLDSAGGNPSSVHRSGRAARFLLDEARGRTAAALAVHEDEILFTSGGTESVNLALLGAARGRAGPGTIVTSVAEHSSVLGAVAELEASGWCARRAPVDRHCRIDPDEIVRLGVEGLDILSVMAANNEVGTIEPLQALAARLPGHHRERGRDRRDRVRPLFHTDAVQALGRIPVRIGEWGVDLASFSVHKLGGPLGAGILYRRKGLPLRGPLFGGGQEGGLRPGSENVAAISAGALAVELAVKEQPRFRETAAALSLRLWKDLALTLPDVELLGDPVDSDQRLPNTLSISIGGLDGRMLVARLDLEGLEVSAGSACASGSLEPSHVLLAMGLDRERARSGLRLSLGRTTTAEEIAEAVRILARTVAALR